MGTDGSNGSGPRGNVPQQILLSGDGVLQLLPQRPDAPDCQYFQRHGRCKYGASCRYHHPIQFHRRSSEVPGGGGGGGGGRRHANQHIDRYNHGNEGSVYNGTNFHFTTQQTHSSQQTHQQEQQQQQQQQQEQQQRGPTHVLVTDTPVTVMTLNGNGNGTGNVGVGGRNHFGNGSTGIGGPYQVVPSPIHEGEYAIPVGSNADRISTTSSLGSAYDTPVSNIDYLSSSLPTKQELWNRVGPSRTASTNSLSTYGEARSRLVNQGVSSNGLGGNGNGIGHGNENVRRHRAASFGSIGSASMSEHSIGMPMNGQANLYHDNTGVLGWSMPVHQESYETENNAQHGGQQQQQQQQQLHLRRQHVPYGLMDGPIHEEPGSRMMRRQNAGTRFHHERQPTDGGVDQGLSMMTSALLNMMDTPDDMNGMMRGLPSRISSSSTLNNQLSPPQTPKNNQPLPSQEPTEQMLSPQVHGNEQGRSGNESQHHPREGIVENPNGSRHTESMTGHPPLNSMNMASHTGVRMGGGGGGGGVRNEGTFMNDNGLRMQSSPFTPQRLYDQGRGTDLNNGNASSHGGLHLQPKQQMHSADSQRNPQQDVQTSNGGMPSSGWSSMWQHDSRQSEQLHSLQSSLSQKPSVRSNGTSHNNVDEHGNDTAGGVGLFLP